MSKKDYAPKYKSNTIFIRMEQIETAGWCLVTVAMLLAMLYLASSY